MSSNAATTGDNPRMKVETDQLRYEGSRKSQHWYVGRDGCSQRIGCLIAKDHREDLVIAFQQPLHDPTSFGHKPVTIARSIGAFEITVGLQQWIIKRIY